MENLILIVIALSLALSSFGLSAFSSFSYGGFRAGTPMKASLLFALVHILLLLAGKTLAGFFASYFAGQQTFLAFLVLAGLSAKRIWDVYKLKPLLKAFDFNAIATIMGLAVAKGMDALFIGFALMLYGLPMGGLYVVLPVSVFLLVFSGLRSGEAFGERFIRYAELAGAILLAGVALVFLMR